jgi:hypothetical protein
MLNAGGKARSQELRVEFYADQNISTENADAAVSHDTDDRRHYGEEAAQAAG